MADRKRPASPLATALWLTPLVFVSLLLLLEHSVLSAAVSALGAGAGSYLGQRWSLRRWQAARASQAPPAARGLSAPSSSCSSR